MTFGLTSRAANKQEWIAGRYLSRLPILASTTEARKPGFAMLLIYLPCSSLVVLLSAPHASSFFDPSLKGSPDGEESDCGAGEPQASSALTGAVAAQGRAETQSFDKSWLSPFLGLQNIAL